MIVTRRTVVVRDLEIRLSIGIHPHEKIAPQRLIVSVEAELADLATPHGDHIATTVDYDSVCDFIRSLAHEPHVELQETVAQRILDHVLFLPGVGAATVETRKPDIFDDCDYVGVTISARRA